jgi:hypothetical protein
MNGNDESAALLQLSGGSNVDVDEPAAGATTTTTAREDVSASIPNEDAHISEQMQLLRVYCESDSLTEQGLRERLSHFDLEHTIDYSSYDILLLAICYNKRVTCGIVQFFLRRFPAPDGYTAPNGFTPLHALCSNKNATIDIVRCVIEGNPGALVAQDRAGRTPLVHLCMNEELDNTMSEKILKFILFKCPDARSGDFFRLSTRLLIIVLPNFAACSSRHIHTLIVTKMKACRYWFVGRFLFC